LLTVIYVGRHEIRLAEPALCALRLIGDLKQAEFGEILDIVREYIHGQDSRLLFDVSELSSLGFAWRREVELLKWELDADICPARHVVFVGAHMLHRVILAPLLSRNGRGSWPQLLIHFVQSQKEALAWLQISDSTFLDCDAAIYVTRIF
jgi:hypothetical protein